MSNIDQIIPVTIAAGTTYPSRAGFGTPLFLAYHTRFVENFRSYTTLSGILSDGFTVNDPAYLMATAAFSQEPSPERVILGRLPEPGSAHVTTLDCSGIVDGQTIAMTVRDSAGNITAVSQAFDTDEDTTATALAALVGAAAGLSAAAVGALVTCTADANGPIFFFEDVSGPCNVLDTTADWGYDTQLGVILNETSAFYAVCIDVNSAANVADVAAWALANDRIAAFGPQATNPAAYNAAVGSALASGGNDRAFSLVKRTARSMFPECAQLGEALPFDPGSQTWSFKTLAGVTPDGWTDTELTTIEASSSNHYTGVSGLSLTRNGTMHGGEYIDVVRGLDWLKARLQERMLALLANNRKVPYTDSGVQLIVNAVREILREAVRKEVLDSAFNNGTGFLVTFTKVADIPEADRAARILSGIEFSGRLAGAVHNLPIRGTVSV